MERPTGRPAEGGMRTWVAVLRWITLLPIVVGLGQVAGIALSLLADWGMASGGGMEPGSPEYRVMSWTYQLVGDAVSGGVAVWLAWRWAPSRRVSAALVTCVLLCVASCAFVYLAFVGRVPLGPSDLPRTIATVVGALLGMGYALGLQSGDENWLEERVASGWHGAGQGVHLVVAGLAAAAIWWQAASPVASWHEATAGASTIWWAVGAGTWLWHMLITALLAYIVALVLVLLLLLLLKLPFVLIWRLATHPQPAERKDTDVAAPVR